jgi:hypothetical protein
MARQKRQSNSKEMCPVCRMVLSTRFSAVSHYRKHVRNGELIGHGSITGSKRGESGQWIYFRDESKPTEFRLPTHQDQQGAWWDRGVNLSSTLMSDDKDLDRRLSEFNRRHEFPRLYRRR